MRKQAQKRPTVQVGRDPETGDAVQPHRVNPVTGMYKGRQVLTIKDDQ